MTKPYKKFSIGDKVYEKIWINIEDNKFHYVPRTIVNTPHRRRGPYVIRTTSGSEFCRYEHHLFSREEYVALRLAGKH